MRMGLDYDPGNLSDGPEIYFKNQEEVAEFDNLLALKELDESVRYRHLDTEEETEAHI